MTNEEFVYYLHSMRIGNTDAALDASNRIAKYACELRTQLQAANERIERLTYALKWYASNCDPGQFSIVDDKGRWLSDFHSFGDRARATLTEIEKETP